MKKYLIVLFIAIVGFINAQVVIYNQNFNSFPVDFSGSYGNFSGTANWITDSVVLSKQGQQRPKNLKAVFY